MNQPLVVSRSFDQGGLTAPIHTKSMDSDYETHLAKECKTKLLEGKNGLQTWINNIVPVYFSYNRTIEVSLHTYVLLRYTIIQSRMKIYSSLK